MIPSSAASCTPFPQRIAIGQPCCARFTSSVNPIRNQALIEEYKIYTTKVASLYDELESQGSFKKEKLLRNIKTLYLKTAGSYIKNAESSLENIRSNADDIIDDIEEELENILIKEDSTNSSDYAFAISIIMVDAFMRCKILEEPAK